MSKHMASKGIEVQITVPYAHAQNSKIERYICTIEDGIQMLIANSKLPLSFWGDAALTFVYLCNRLPTSMLLDDTTPYEIMNPEKPNLSHLRVWGCQCFLIISPEIHTKGGPRHFEVIFLGYEDNRIGWCVHDLHGKYHFSRDVIFNKSIPGHLLPCCGIPINFTSLPPPSIILDVNSNETSPKLPITQPHTSLTPLYTPTLSDTIHDHDVTVNAHIQCITRTGTNSLPKPRPHYNDIHTIMSFISINNTNFSNLSSHSFEHTTHQDLFNLSFLSPPLPSFQGHLMDLSKPPNTYHKALMQSNKDVWISAMRHEFDSLEEHKAFECTTLPNGQKAIGVCWTYDYKYNPDGSIIIGREKGHLVT
jgi:hypothetical protein